MPRMSINRPPKSQFRGVSVVFSDGRWKYRAFCRIGGSPRVGSYRLTQEEAAADYLRLVETAPPLTRSTASLSLYPGCPFKQALEAVITQSQRRSSIPVILGRTMRTSLRFVLRFIPGDRVTKTISEHEILCFVHSALAAGRHPNTLLTKDLPLVSRAFKLARLADPVPGVRRAIPNLRRVRTLPQRLSLEEVRAIIERIRESDPEKYPLAQRDADIFEFAAYTGIRAGELARLRQEDLDAENCSAAVLTAKDRTHPRIIPLPEGQRPLLERLRSYMKRGTLFAPGYGQSLNNIVVKWKHRLGEPLFNLRALRRCYATELLNRGAALLVVRDLMGHKHLSTTDLYVSASPETSRKAVEAILGGAAL